MAAFSSSDTADRSISGSAVPVLTRWIGSDASDGSASKNPRPPRADVVDRHIVERRPFVRRQDHARAAPAPASAIMGSAPSRKSLPALSMKKTALRCGGPSSSRDSSES